MDEFKKDFVRFRNECEALCVLVNTFSELFENGDQTKDLLQRTAFHFFDDLREWMTELFILRVGRLTDLASYKKNSNLSVSFILEQLLKFKLTSAQASDLGGKLNDYGSMTKAARHRRVAHTDLEATRNPDPLGSTTPESFHAFMTNLNLFTDEVGNLIGEGPLDYGSSSGPGDVLDLLSALENRRKCK